MRRVFPKVLKTKKEIQMSHVQLESAAQHEVALAVLAHLENGETAKRPLTSSGVVKSMITVLGWNLRTQGD
jgi:hypothetical protein